ncbi:MAG: ferritin-like domain-containing protein, partial [Gallionellaceae bacterium]
MPQSKPEDMLKGLFSRIKQHNERVGLQEAAQLAIQVEWTTIPAYLTALFSIKQLDSQAYQMLRSVVMEEMFHINQAANILVSIGGQPCFSNRHEQEKVVPQYPGYLPHANTKTTPYVGLYRASTDVFENVFAAIEKPAPYMAPPEGDNYNTIA